MVGIATTVKSGTNEQPCAAYRDRRVRCLFSHTATSRKPVVAISIDGVLARQSQFVINIMNDAGRDTGSMNAPLHTLHCSTCKHHCDEASDQDLHRDAYKVLQGIEHGWLEVEPYDDVDFQELNRGMKYGDFHGCFVASRFFLSPSNPASSADPGYLTKAWLDIQNGAPFEFMNLAADLCAARVISYLELMGVDYFLTDNPADVLKAREAGIEAYLIDRPYNQTPLVSHRVSSVSEFLQQTVYAEDVY